MKPHQTLKLPAIALMALLILGSAGPVPLAAESAAGPAATLRFATLPAESAIPLIIAQEKGLFRAAGVTVELLPFNSPLDRNIAAQSGKLDGMIADVMTALAFHEAGLRFVITSDINEDFKLLVSPKSGIKGWPELDGKDVSVVPNFALEYIMDRLAAGHGIRYRLVSIPSIPARFEALLADRISGVVFTEPQATLLAGKGCRVLGGSRESGLQAGAFLVSAAFIKDHPAELKAFYRAYNQAVALLGSTDPAELAPSLARFGFPPAVRDYLGSARYRPAGAIPEAVFADILAWSKTKKLVSRDTSLSEVADQRFIP